MERIGTKRRLLRRKIAAVFVLAALLSAVCAVCLSGAAYAAPATPPGTSPTTPTPVIDMDDPEVERLATDMKLGVILALIEIEYLKRMDYVSDMEKTDTENHNRDHKQLSSNPDAVAALPAMSGYDTLARAGINGYRGAAPTIYSTRYKDREAAFRGAMGGAADANREVAEKNVADMDDRIALLQKMEWASQSADGYLALIQGGTQEANYLNLELADLRSDTMRQVDIQLRAAMEEAQDDFDITSAFEGAVSTWKNHTGTGEY